MKKRGLDIAAESANGSHVTITPRKNFDFLAGPLANSYLVPDEPENADEEGSRLQDYTWKAMLCECSEPVEALQLQRMLLRERIQSWVEAMPSYAIGVGNPRVFVAADELEKARAIVTQPIPQDVIDEVNEEMRAPNYEVPTCPKCRAADPTLESVEPSNNWLCESCGCAWSDPVVDDAAGPKSGG